MRRVVRARSHHIRPCTVSDDTPPSLSPAAEVVVTDSTVVLTITTVEAVAVWCVVLGATEAPPASPDSLVASPDAQRVAVGGSGSKAVTLTVSGTGRQVAYCTAQDRAGNTAPVVTSGAFGVGVHSDGSSPWLYVGLGAAGLVVAAVVVAGIWRYRRPAPAPAAIPIDAEDAPAMGVADSAAGKPAAAAASATVSIPAISLYASSPHNSLAQAMTLHAEAYVQQCGCVCPCNAGAPCSPFGVVPLHHYRICSGEPHREGTDAGTVSTSDSSFHRRYHGACTRTDVMGITVCSSRAVRRMVQGGCSS